MNTAQDKPSQSTGGAARFGDLRVRILSSIALAGIALAAVWIGGILIALLAAVAALAMMLEWRSITAHGGQPCTLDAAGFAVAACGGALIWTAFGNLPAILWLVVVAAAAFALDVRAGRRAAGQWSLIGAFYIGAAAIAFVALRGVEAYGFRSILWAALVVIAADVGGYFAGRLIGGPKLWPAVSPKKTWAGLGGGIALAFIVGGIFSWATTGTYFHQVCTVSAIAALLAQGGDLAESALKRHFGVKDASALIPGHGGVLDRLDGHMAAVLVAAVVTFSRGQAVFVW